MPPRRLTSGASLSGENTSATTGPRPRELLVGFAVPSPPPFSRRIAQPSSSCCPKARRSEFSRHRQPLGRACDPPSFSCSSAVCCFCSPSLRPCGLHSPAPPEEGRGSRSSPDCSSRDSSSSSLLLPPSSSLVAVQRSTLPPAKVVSLDCPQSHSLSRWSLPTVGAVFVKSLPS